MPSCTNCGSFVTQDFARVFGDNQDHVAGCINCRTFRELQSGGGTPPGVGPMPRLHGV